MANDTSKAVAPKVQAGPLKTPRKVRTVKLTDDPVANVRVVASNRLGKVVKAITALGRCSGKKFKYTDAQIDKIGLVINNAVNTAFDAIRSDNDKPKSEPITL